MCVIYFKIAQEVSESRNEFMQRVKTKQVPEQLSSKTQTIHSDSKSTPDYFTPHNFTLYMAGRKRQRRCEQCPGCISTDCNQCKFCLDKPKNGGPGIKKQCCIKRKCIRTAKAEADVANVISRLHHFSGKGGTI